MSPDSFADYCSYPSTPEIIEAPYHGYALSQLMIKKKHPFTRTRCTNHVEPSTRIKSHTAFTIEMIARKASVGTPSLFYFGPSPLRLKS